MPVPSLPPPPTPPSPPSKPSGFCGIVGPFGDKLNELLDKKLEMEGLLKDPTSALGPLASKMQEFEGKLMAKLPKLPESLRDQLDKIEDLKQKALSGDPIAALGLDAMAAKWGGDILKPLSSPCELPNKEVPVGATAPVEKPEQSPPPGEPPKPLEAPPAVTDPSKAPSKGRRLSAPITVINEQYHKILDSSNPENNSYENWWAMNVLKPFLSSGGLVDSFISKKKFWDGISSGDKNYDVPSTYRDCWKEKVLNPIMKAKGWDSYKTNGISWKEFEKIYVDKTGKKTTKELLSEKNAPESHWLAYNQLLIMFANYDFVRWINGIEFATHIVLMSIADTNSSGWKNTNNGNTDAVVDTIVEVIKTNYKSTDNSDRVKTIGRRYGMPDSWNIGDEDVFFGIKEISEKKPIARFPKVLIEEGVKATWPWYLEKKQIITEYELAKNPTNEEKADNVKYEAGRSLGDFTASKITR